MKPFTKHTGLVAPMDRVNVDTDQMVPKQYLKLQENLQNESRQFTCLSNLMKTKFNTMKGVLSNIR